MLHGLLRRGVDDFGEQAVVLILDGEARVRYHRLRHELVGLAVVPGRAILIQDVDVAVFSEGPDGLEALFLLDDGLAPLQPLLPGESGLGFLVLHAFFPPYVTSPSRLKALSL